MIVAIVKNDLETVEAVRTELGYTSADNISLKGFEGEVDAFYMGGKLRPIHEVRPVFEDWKRYSADPRALVIVDKSVDSL